MLPPVEVLWAKSAGEDGSWHTLPAHLLDVAAVAAALLHAEPARLGAHYAVDLGAVDREQAMAWAAALAGLHDLGKASPAFQRLWPEGEARARAAGFRFPPPTSMPHGVLTHTLLPSLLETRGWSAGLAADVARAVAAHHGWEALPVPRGRGTRFAEAGYDPAWGEAREALVGLVCDATGARAPLAALRLSAGVWMRLAGLTAVADWLASDPSLFPRHTRGGGPTERGRVVPGTVLVPTRVGVDRPLSPPCPRRPGSSPHAWGIRRRPGPARVSGVGRSAGGRARAPRERSPARRCSVRQARLAAP